MAVTLLLSISCICFFILAFIAIANPLRVNIVANKWLGLFFISVAMMMLSAAIISFGAAARYSRLIGFNELPRFAMMPALYLAIMQFTTPGSKFRTKDSLHFIPFLAFGLWLVPSLVFRDQRLFGITEFISQWIIAIIKTGIVAAIKIQFLVYWILSYRLLTIHQRHIKLVASDVQAVSLNWLKYLLLVIGFMLVLFYVTIIFKISVSNAFVPLMHLCGGLAILYYSLAQREIFPFEADDLREIRQVFVTIDEETRPVKQRITYDEAFKLQSSLKHLMATEKLYLDSELSLPLLANRMAITVNELSYLLNETIGTNFFNFINSYRVKEAQQLLLSNQHKHLNMLGIAYSAGFSSKTTFNTAFKKLTGLSPSQFIKQANNRNSQVSTV